MKKAIKKWVAKLVMESLNQEYPPELVKEILTLTVKRPSKGKVMVDITDEEYDEVMASKVAGYKRLRKELF